MWQLHFVDLIKIPKQLFWIYFNGYYVEWICYNQMCLYRKMETLEDRDFSELSKVWGSEELETLKQSWYTIVEEREELSLQT